MSPHLYSMLFAGIRCMGCFHTFLISNKEEPEEILESKKEVHHFMKNISIISEEENYFESQLPRIVEENFCANLTSTIGNWPVQSD